MLLSWTSAQVRAAEAPLLAAGAPLMQRASFALAGAVARVLRERRGRVVGGSVVLLVGPGNNGGDALHAGAHLRARGVDVLALALAPRVHDEGRAALLAVGGRVLVVDEDGVEAAAARAARADVVLDGVLGIGARPGGLTGVAGALVARLSADDERAPAVPVVVAVDTPSGIGVDDGSAAGTVLRADRTVTFGAPKPGLLLPPATALAGEVEVVDIGLDLPDPPAVARLEDHDAAELWPVPTPAAHKYSRGVVGVVAGARRYPGAAVLATSAAVLAGVGMVRYLGDVADLVVARRPEVVVGPGRVQAWVFGPGVSPDDAAQRRRIEHAFEGVVNRGEPAVVDAGALELLPPHVPAHVVLTPHAGELARLLTDRGHRVDRAHVEAHPLHHARLAHELTGATVLLKGHVTLVVGPGGATYAQADAPAWLATAGAGDVLAGLLGAMLAARAADVVDDPSLTAALAAAAALVHGRAARTANPDGPVTARGIALALPETVRALLATGRATTARSAGPAGRGGRMGR
ncbi:bifunctional ADP-dependent NAD(P)H-hydrate dehydratase/NAD(P)H-hydrate epimerase [Cellulomonas palmilytica]|uniref:bifunctional ADP-dependent NAD(P)H-hydrate dehydratase/NAD(P)H-hydrate epimerase n=1 Tax=Cellulomonas palmilytica TaxID=2608402 RepID=UPI001F1A6102|nr:bifunctional ADP-dependent NAD(P)H-hydrate dehydratase/NAD(P)H-hydrate epimerase [Cellulomonas palmilytica]UJP39755.1 bifunctional ADP-dependent NAD(P)H-hydrate dehydratase/NAD(P)H-hydrate epimerase [Cellulomonas palmilytica]